MAPIRLLSAADVERLLDLDALIDALARAFGRLSSGDALLGVMPGHLPGTGPGVKLVSVVPAHHARGHEGEQELSVFKSMGHAVEDLAPAALVIERAEIEGVGTNVEL